MTISINILGSTGSIGTSALRMIQTHPHDFKVIGLAAGRNVEVLASQIREHRPELVSVADDDSLVKLKALLGPNDPQPDFFVGTSGAETVAQANGASLVLSAIVGASGLKPTLAALTSGKHVALANKESMVVAGSLVNAAAKANDVDILPVDSEHSAIDQCLQACSDNKDIERLILTASGGPFFLKPEITFESVTPEMALKHPNWDMGAKITIDSATMMNKGLELIEAHWLFDLPPSRLSAIVHPQSIVHSMVECIDGSVLAQLGVPDMAGPIAYAMSHRRRLPKVTERLSFEKLARLTFMSPDKTRYPSIPTALSALEAGPLHPAVLNAANEIAVEAFLRRSLRFDQIFSLVDDTLSAFEGGQSTCLEDHLDADRWAREKAQKSLTSFQTRQVAGSDLERT